MAGGRVSGRVNEQLEEGNFSEGNIIISDHVLGGVAGERVNDQLEEGEYGCVIISEREKERDKNRECERDRKRCGSGSVNNQ